MSFTNHTTHAENSPSPFHSRSRRNQASRISDNERAVSVAVRVRPFLPFETDASEGLAVYLPDSSGTQISLTPRHGSSVFKTFRFDHVFWSVDQDSDLAMAESHQAAIFEALGTPAVQAAVDGYHSCVLAYGQTGSGKTYTMLGPANAPGIVPRATRKLFELLRDALDPQAPRRDSRVVHVDVCALEIYNESIYDLLSQDNYIKTSPSAHRGSINPQFVSSPNASGRPLKVRQNSLLGAVVPGLTTIRVHNETEALEAFRLAFARRTTAATQMNERSSRSHAIFRLIVTVQELGDPQTQTRSGCPPGQSPPWTSLQVSAVNLVDLAGSERAGQLLQPGMAGYDDSVDHLREAKSINLSLSTLRRVIDTLIQLRKQPQANLVPPYRESQLTMMLADSFGGNSVTSFIACVSPSMQHYEETVSTLSYASSAKDIVNVVRKNIQRSDDHVHRLKEEIRSLQVQLSLTVSPDEAEEMRRRVEEYQRELQQLEEGTRALIEAHIQERNRLVEEVHNKTEKLQRLESALGQSSRLRDEMEATLDELRARNAELEESIRRKSLEVMQLQNDIIDLKEKKELAEKRSTQLESQLQEALRTVEGLTERSRDAEREAGSLRLELERVRMELKEVCDKNASLEEIITQTKSELSSARLSLSQESSRADDLAAQVAALEAQVGRSPFTITEIDQIIRHRLTELSQEAAHARAALRTTEDLLQVRNSEIESLSSQLAALKADRDSLREAADRHVASLSQVESKLIEAEAQVTSLQNEVAILKDQKHMLEQRLTDTRNALEDREKQLQILATERSKIAAEAEAQNTALMRRISHLSKQVEHLETAKTNAETRESALRDEISRINAESREKDAQVRELLAQLEEAKSVMLRAQRSRDEMAERYEKLKEELSGLIRSRYTSPPHSGADVTGCTSLSHSGVCREVESRTFLLSTRVSELETEVSRLRAALSAKDVQVDTLVRENSRLRTELHIQARHNSQMTTVTESDNPGPDILNESPGLLMRGPTQTGQDTTPPSPSPQPRTVPEQKTAPTSPSPPTTRSL